MANPHNLLIPLLQGTSLALETIEWFPKYHLITWEKPTDSNRDIQGIIKCDLYRYHSVTFCMYSPILTFNVRELVIWNSGMKYSITKWHWLQIIYLCYIQHQGLPFTWTLYTYVLMKYKRSSEFDTSKSLLISQKIYLRIVYVIFSCFW